MWWKRSCSTWCSLKSGRDDELELHKISPWGCSDSFPWCGTQWILWAGKLSGECNCFIFDLPVAILPRKPFQGCLSVFFLPDKLSEVLSYCDHYRGIWFGHPQKQSSLWSAVSILFPALFIAAVLCCHCTLGPRYISATNTIIASLRSSGTNLIVPVLGVSNADCHLNLFLCFWKCSGTSSW